MNSSQLHFTFTEDAPQRIDKFLTARITELSRSRLQVLIDDGRVTVNGEIPHKAGFALSSGDQIEVFIPPTAPSTLIPEAIPLDVIFENDDVLVINKSAGMVVHPAAGMPAAHWCMPSWPMPRKLKAWAARNALDWCIAWIKILPG